MYLAVAIYTESDSVGNIKTELRIVSPRLNVMTLYLALCPTLNASIAVTSIDCTTPSLQFCSQSRSLSLKRFAVLPSRSRNAYHELMGAIMRTKLLFFRFGDEGLSAEQTISSIYNATMRPTFLGAVVRCASPIGMGFVFFVAYITSKHNSTSLHVSFLHISLAVCVMYYSRYGDIMQAKSAYEAETGHTATLLSRHEEAVHV